MNDQKLTIVELVRRKVSPGEDPSIFQRKLNLNGEEIELCERYGSLGARELGVYISKTGLIPGRVICYVTEGYDGPYTTGWSFPMNMRTKCYVLEDFNLGSFPRGIEQTENIQTLAELVAKDFETVSGQMLNAKGKPCEPECSATNYIHVLTSGFCGVSLDVGKKKDVALYNLIRAYAVNIMKGI